MGTRCGRLDAAVVLYLMRSRGMSTGEVEKLLFRESGLLGLSGVSSDMRELEASKLPAAAEAITHFVEQVVQHMGCLAAALRGVDAIVFTGGIGENAAALRERMVRGCAWLGAALDADTNRGHAARITTADSRLAAFVVRTDEEAVIARHTARVAGLGGAAAPAWVREPGGSRGAAPGADSSRIRSPSVDATTANTRPQQRA